MAGDPLVVMESGLETRADYKDSTVRDIVAPGGHGTTCRPCAFVCGII